MRALGQHDVREGEPRTLMSAALNLLLMHVPLWLGAWRLARRLPRPMPVRDALFATVVIGFAMLVVLEATLGAIGALSFAAVVAGELAFLFLSFGVSRRCSQDHAAPMGAGNPVPRVAPTRQAGERGARLATIVMTAAVVWAAVQRLVRGLLLPVEPVSDGPIYHLYFAVRWWQGRAIEVIPTPFGELAAAYFPAHGSLWFTWLLWGTGDETLAKVGQWPFLGVAAAAVYGLARRLGAGERGALFPAAVFSSTFAALGFAAVPNVDLIYTAFFLLAVYWLVEGVHDRVAGGGRFPTPGGDPTSALRADSATVSVPVANRASVGEAVPLGLSALAAGLALGTKTIGVAFLPPIVAGQLLLAATAIRRGRACLLVVAGIMVGGGFWYLRNLWLTGNPLYPLQVNLLGIELFPGWYEAAAMRQSSYHVPPSNLAVGWERLMLMLDGRLAWWWGVGIVAGVGGLRRRRRGLEEWLSAALVAYALLAAALFWWGVPYNTQERFLLPALALAVVPLARLVERRPWLQIAVASVVVWHLFTPTWRSPFGLPSSVILVPLDPRLSTLVMALVDWARGAPAAVGIGRFLETLGPAGFSLVLPASSLAGAWLVGRLSPSGVAGGIAIAVVGVGVTVATLQRQMSMNVPPWARFYPQTEFAQHLLPAWRALEQASTEGSHVAYAGTNVPYYLFGLRLRNHVEYVNVHAPVAQRLHDDHRHRRAQGAPSLAPSPYPQWHRESPDFETWWKNLEERRIDLLFVARENYHGRLDLPQGLAPFPIELEWATGHPDRFLPLPLPPGVGEPWARVFRVLRYSPSAGH